MSDWKDDSKDDSKDDLKDGFHPKINIAIDFGTDGTGVAYSFPGSDDVYIFTKFTARDDTRKQSHVSKARTAILFDENEKFLQYGQNALKVYVFQYTCINAYVCLWLQCTDTVEWRVMIGYCLIISKWLYMVYIFIYVWLCVLDICLVCLYKCV